jgi:RNA recognition motif-containing protein
MSHHSQQSKSSLFIGDLAIFCTEEDIRRAFSAYGEVTEVKIIKSEETSRNLSYGFITFSTMEAAFEALNRLNGQLLCGRPMR